MPAKRKTQFVTRGEFRTFATSIDARFASIDTRFDRSDETQRAMGVLLERIDSNVKALAEGQESLRKELKTDMQALEERLGKRIEALEAVVRQNSLDIRKNSQDIRKNSEDIRKLSAEVAELRQRFDRQEVRLEDLEKRATELEKRAGIATDP